MSMGTNCALGVAAVIVICLLFPPKANKEDRSAEEAAIGAIRTLHTAQVSYYSQYGKYADSLTELRPPTSGTKSGYHFTFTGNAGGYVIHANPESSRSRAFYSDQSMVLRQNYGAEPATANGPEL